MENTIRISVSDLIFLPYAAGYGWSQRELKVGEFRFGAVCYATCDRVPDTDLFVIVDANLPERYPKDVSRNKGFLKVIFPRVRRINGTIYLGQDKLNDAKPPDGNIKPEYEDREPFDQKIEGEYKIHTINLPLRWYLGCQTLDDSINELDVPLTRFAF